MAVTFCFFLGLASLFWDENSLKVPFLLKEGQCEGSKSSSGDKEFFMQKTNTAHLPLPKIKVTSRQKSYGTYLYLKVNTFYFRYAFTASQKEAFGKSEIRISLRTGFLREAKKKVRTLRSTLEVLLMSEEAKDVEDLKLKLTYSLEKLLATCPNKRELSIQEIKMRLNNYLQVMIMEADDELYRPEGAIIYDERIDFLPTDPKYWLEFNKKILMLPLG